MANRGSIEYGGGSREVDFMRDDRVRGEREWLAGEGETRGEWGGGWYEESGGPWTRGYAGGSSGGRRAGFAGRGPKGYQRSDERIREDVCERLSEEGEVDASDIEVVVTASEVTLDGQVDSKEARRLAEELVEDTPGVRHVNNNLRVKKGFFAKLFGGGDDEESDSERIQDKYRGDTRI
ncbi:MAG: BON domain-containing protein [Thermoanaerobaculia bacterium]